MNQTREYRGTLRGTHDEYGRPTNSSTIHADRQGVALLHIHSISVGDKWVWKNRPADVIILLRLVHVC